MPDIQKLHAQAHLAFVWQVTPFMAVKSFKKPYIGDDKRAVLPEDICRCNYLMYAAAVLGEVICVVLMILLKFTG